ncbi:hypothetical protein HZC31_05795 [Candidatus Woesearchaeota archaeon]|nr:hypothetical protein [Candidatus Woesearchaeota archaeon]
MNNSVKTVSLKLIALLLALLVMPFAAADSVSSLLSSYEKSQEKFLDLKDELKECQLLDDGCEDIEDELLDAALPYAKDTINLMLAYVYYVNDATNADAQEELEQALDDLQYADSKEEYDDVLAAVKTAWKSIADDLKQKTVEDLFAAVDALVDKGEIIDAKLACGIGELSTSSTALDDAYTTFSADIAKADEQIDAAEDLLNSGGDLTDVVATIKSAQEALKSSQTSLTTARDALTAKGGTLCAEVVIEDDDADEDDDAEETEDEEVEEEPEEEVEEEQDLDTLLNDYDLDSYYEDAQDAIETLVEYIEEQQGDDYDTSKAEVVLAQAEAYLEDAEELVLTKKGVGAISKLLNAQQTAQRGLNSEYYKAGSGSSSGGSATADYQAFVDCMESASYSYQRTACYDDYGIDGDTQTEIADCLAAANAEDERLDCYSEAEEEAALQEGDDEEALRDRLETLEDDLDDLEDDVTALYNELSQSGESSTSDDYKDVDSAIDDLLDEVQEANQGYADDMDDIDTKIDLGDESEADDLLDDLEDEVADYIEDMEAEIADIQDDIDAL